MTELIKTLFGEIRKPPVIVSLCWTGEPCRYHGRPMARPSLLGPLRKKYKLVPVCPERLGGLPVPRPPAPLSRKRGQTITNVLGADVSPQFKAGAEKALEIALANKCRKAFLCKGSPSCDKQGFFGELCVENEIEVNNF